jgi:hypothetical protein
MTWNRVRLAVILAAIATWSGVGYGRRVAVSHYVPAAEAVANAEAWIQAHPKDGAGYCALGRVHALAWAYGEKIPLLGSGGEDALPGFSEVSTVLVARTGPGEMVHEEPGAVSTPGVERKERAVTGEEARHLTAAIAAYRKAIELDTGDALSELALGWMLAQQGIYARELPADSFGEVKATKAESAAWAQAIGQLADEDPKVRDRASQALLGAMPRCVLALRDVPTDDPETKARIDGVLRDHYDAQALEHYRKAFDLRVAADLKGEPTYQADSQVSAKAGAQILAALARQPAAAKQGEVKTVQEALDPLTKKMQQLMMMPQ